MDSHSLLEEATRGVVVSLRGALAEGGAGEGTGAGAEGDAPATEAA